MSTMRRALSNENGFTMLAVVLCMTAAMGLALAGWAAAGGDMRIGQRNSDAKRAYAAAEAGLADYLDKLSQDNEYWLKCTNVPPLPNGQPAPVNQPYTPSANDTRRWRALPTDPAASYTIELIPKPGASSCDTTKSASDMQAADGTIKLRATGRVGRVYRSIVATLRRRGFLDFLYFTKYETGDPTQLLLATNGLPTRPCGPTGNCAQESIADWAAREDTCTKYVKDGRDSVTYPGSVQFNGSWVTPNPPIRCMQIVFIDNDAIRGPFHTNDTMRTCGNPDFGRKRASNPTADPDDVEFYGYIPCNGGSPDTGQNNVVTGEDLEFLEMPETNASLQSDADPAYVFTGRTTIELQGSTMIVNGASMPLPPNGLIYVRNHPTNACPVFNPIRPYAPATNCGDVYLKGNYSKSLTIAAERDIVVSDDVLRSDNNALLGLIANNFVRVEHHIQGESATQQTPCDSGDQDSGAEINRRIDAAILSLRHVFTVDQYQCGDPLGTLTVFGAIAQKYRGPVGTTGGTGYVKDYQYNDQLKYRSPPYFLSPVQAAWRVIRSTEQSPATKPTS